MNEGGSATYIFKAQLVLSLIEGLVRKWYRGKFVLVIGISEVFSILENRIEIFHSFGSEKADFSDQSLDRSLAR
jgi:hypothetical protein